MTPEQKQQIEGVRSAVKRLGGTVRPEWMLAELRREGWPEAAIQHVLTERRGE